MDSDFHGDKSHKTTKKLRLKMFAAGKQSVGKLNTFWK